MRLVDLSAGYAGKPVLSHFDLELPERGVVCLLSPSGSGKTTLLRILCGLKTDYTGRIEGLSGRPVAVFQEDRLLPCLTALDNVRLPLAQEDWPLAQQALAGLGLAGEEETLPGQLSGGMQRRVALARAMAFVQACRRRGEEVFFLLDEPFKGLDPNTKARTMAALRPVTRDCLTLFVTHDREEALAFGDWLVQLLPDPLRVQSFSPIPQNNA